jgi:hypothetical protein
MLGVGPALGAIIVFDYVDIEIQRLLIAAGQTAVTEP